MSGRGKQRSKVSPIKAWLRRHPRLYDLSVRVRRAVGIRTPIAEVLHHFSLANGRRVRFIQIGASDGLHSDPIREFIVRDRWSGVLVEPLPDSFARLQANYCYLHHRGLVFVNAAIVAPGTEAPTFWTLSESFTAPLSEEGRLDLLQKSSFHREHVAGLLGPSADSSGLVVAMVVHSLTLPELIARYLNTTTFDLLVMDCEDYEASLIPTINWEQIRPKAVLYESHNLRDGAKQVKVTWAVHGYCVFGLGGDSIAIRRDFLREWRAQSAWAQRHLLPSADDADPEHTSEVVR